MHSTFKSGNLFLKWLLIEIMDILNDHHINNLLKLHEIAAINLIIQ